MMMHGQTKIKLYVIVEWGRGRRNGLFNNYISTSLVY